MIWAEIPFVNQVTGEEAENAKSQLREMIRQSYNHPSIYVWGLHNEVYSPTPYTAQLTAEPVSYTHLDVYKRQVYICKADLTYFGGEAASQKDYISVPHNHDITKHVKPGEKHLLTVCVDNRFQYQTHKWNHAHTEFTQINWNGILGDIKLVAVDPVYVDDMQVYPDVTNKQVTVKMKIKNHTKKVIGGQAVFNRCV